jgi:hypothetical protein
MFASSVCGQNFNKLSPSTDSTYGYSAFNPLKLKKGSPSQSIENAKKFLNGLKTVDDQTLTFLGRSSETDPNFKEPAGEIADFLDAGGVLDRYQFVTSVTKDTIVLFVDIYNAEKLMVPKGLKYVKR